MMFSSTLGEFGLYEEIIEFYIKKRLSSGGDIREKINYNRIHLVVGEVSKNWADHAPENSNLVRGLFLGSKGVCYGFQDGGEFLKKPEIKNQLEKKIYFKKFEDSPREKNSCKKSGFSGGIFPYSDFIEVDSDKGILYCVQLIEIYVL